jgi:stage V sporulation protein SpoVS
MDWGKVVYVFFQLMSLTSVAGFLYDHNGVALFIALSLNLISTILKIGVKNIVAAELFAASLVADLHLIPAFIYLEIKHDLEAAYAMAIGALIANIVTIILSFIEIAKSKNIDWE